MPWVKKTYSIYRISEECDVSVHLTRKIRKKLGYEEPLLKTKEEFDELYNCIQAIKQQSGNSKITMSDIECYFNHLGRHYSTKELIKIFGIKVNDLVKLKHMLGLKGRVYTKEYKKILAVRSLVNMLYGKNVTSVTLGYLENLMKLLDCDNPVELIKKLKGAKEL